MQSKWFLGWGCTLQIQTHWILYQPMSRPRMFRTFGEVLLRSGISLGRESFGLYVMVIKSNSEKVSGFKMELSSRRWVPEGHQVSLKGKLWWTSLDKTVHGVDPFSVTGFLPLWCFKLQALHHPWTYDWRQVS